MPRPVPFSEHDARVAIGRSRSWSAALRFLGYEPKGSNYRTLQRWARIWNIATNHFDPNAGRLDAAVKRRRPIKELLVTNSTYPRGHLKRRLIDTGLKKAVCELCGQGELWNGHRMSLVLDHVNGISNDHRLENLRIVCPNCAATLDTHCGRNLPRERTCPGCGQPFAPQNLRHRYCSAECWGIVAAQLYRGIPHPDTRKVERPPYEQLKADLEAMSCAAVGREYGVSDNAVRKWVRWYERQAEREKSSGGLERHEIRGRVGVRCQGSATIRM